MINVRASKTDNWAADLSASPELQRVVDVFYYSFQHSLRARPQHPVAAARDAARKTISMLGRSAVIYLPGVAEVFVRRFVVWTDKGVATIGEAPEATDLERVHMHVTKFGFFAAKKITARTGIPRKCVSWYLTHLKKTDYSIEATQQALAESRAVAKFLRESQRANASFWLLSHSQQQRGATM
jgi:hypothetical protein